RYNSAGVAYGVSPRTEYLAGCGAALWPCSGAAQNAWRVGCRRRPHAGPNDPQSGHRTPPVCHGPTGQAAGVDAPTHRGGPADGADALAGQAAGRAPRACDPQRQHHTHDEARGGQATRAADRAVEHHWGCGARQNSPCGVAPSTRQCLQQGWQARGVGLAVSAQSSWRRVSLWDRAPRRPGRVEDALTSAGGVPRNLWGAGHACVGGLRPRWLCRDNAAGADRPGGQEDWHPAQRPRSVARCRGRPRDRQERAWKDRRHHWHPEDGQIRVQQAPGTSVADAGDGRSPVYPLLQSEQTDAGSEAGRQGRGKGIRTNRIENPAPVERQEGGQEVSMTFKVVLRHALYTIELATCKARTALL